jgi:sensor c-di-GMP phosphodiesterase-like protein
MGMDAAPVFRKSAAYPLFLSAIAPTFSVHPTTTQGFRQSRQNLVISHFPCDWTSAARVRQGLRRQLRKPHKTDRNLSYTSACNSPGMTNLSAVWFAKLGATWRGRWAIALLFSATSAMISLIVFLAVISSINGKTLRTLDAQLLRRAELAVDYAFIALSELSERGLSNCDANSLAEFRKTIYRYGVIKDIRVSNSSSGVVCSANSETLNIEGASAEAGKSLPSRNERISLFRVDQRDGTALGVRWNYDNSGSLDAIVSTSSLLFDILSQDLRENGTASLTLTDGQAIATQDGDEAVVASAQLRQVSAISERYPLIASIGIDVDTLAKANHEPLVLTLLLFGAIGLAFGVMATKISRQSAGPIAEIDAALARNEFVPFVQPIFSLATRKILGGEVLARWRRADGSLVPPDRFIPTAEQSGRIVPLTWQLVASALSELRGHLAADQQFKIAFNISPAHLLADNFTQDFRQIARSAGVSPRQIVIEITERQEITDMRTASAVLAELRDRGFRIAFDDVGTGHNGLSYIQKLGADIIKIDKFFVDSIAISRSAKVLVEMLVNVGRELNMTTVAEGIETEEQAALLDACGVSQGQGYLVSRPLPVRAFLDLVESPAAAPFAPVTGMEDSRKEAMRA